ncbi:MAG: VTT domain-containing protein [Mongoliitalea sp.]
MRSIIKEFKTGIQENLFLSLAFLWVSIMPSLGTLIATPLVLTRSNYITEFPWLNPFSLLITCLCLTFLMGLALLPTTMVAVFSGFLFGWKIFPLLVASYAAASLLGYFWGQMVTKGGLVFLIKRYPKVGTAIEERSHSIPQLIFFIRISPVIPFALSNLLFAFLQTGWKKLLIWGTIGMLPRTLIAFYTGTIANDLYDAINQGDDTLKVWIFIGFLVVSTWGIWKVIRSKD